MTNRTERLSEIRLQLDEMKRITDTYPYDSKEYTESMLITIKSGLFRDATKMDLRFGN